MNFVFSRYTIPLQTGFFGLLLATLPIEASPPVVLELGQAYQQILDVNLRLKSTEARICSMEGNRQQADAWPNPALEVALSDIGRGPGRDNDNDNNELFVGIVQMVETGGKRAARLRVADSSQCVADWDYEIQKKEVFAQLMHAFITMATAQEGLSLAARQEAIAKTSLECVRERASNGKTSKIEEIKADIAFKKAKITHAKQQTALNKAKKGLSSLWNHCPPAFDSVSYSLHELQMPPCLEILTEALDNHPALVKAMAETANASDILALERTQRIPNIAVQIGLSTQQFVQQPALSLGFEIPIPLFDSNQGNIHRASCEELEAVYDQMDLAARLKGELAETYEEWTGAYRQAIELRDSVLPIAEESMQLAHEGYNAGQFDYLHLLDANSTLFTVKEQYLEAIAEYHHKHAEVLRLTAACSCDAF